MHGRLQTDRTPGSAIAASSDTYSTSPEFLLANSTDISYGPS